MSFKMYKRIDGEVVECTADDRQVDALARSGWVNSPRLLKDEQEVKPAAPTTVTKKRVSRKRIKAED